MNRIDALIVKLGVGVLIAGLGAGVLRWGKIRLVTVGLSASLGVLLLSIWERSRRAGTPFASQEPIWFTFTVRAIPLGLALLAVQKAERKGLPIVFQIAIGTLVGVASNYVAIVLLYLLTGLL